MAYPTTLDSFVVLSGTTLVASDDHANRHNREGSAIVGIETTLGTNAGTSVLKNFSAGKFAVFDNGGTLNNAVIGTPSITGGTINASNLTSPLISNPTNSGLTTLQAVDVLAASYAPGVSGTATLNLSIANHHIITMPAGNITIAISNDVNNQKFMVSILQDGTGSRTVTWFSTIRWVNGVTPTLTTTASKRDYFGFVRTGSGTYDGFVLGSNI